MVEKKSERTRKIEVKSEVIEKLSEKLVASLKPTGFRKRAEVGNWSGTRKLTFFQERPKHFYDIVYGTSLRLSSQAVAILNTPPVQRLRYLRQLPLCYLSPYYQANHTRFEHSIGVAHLLSTVIERMMIEERFTPFLGTACFPSHFDRVFAELCGVLHDLGHGPFGHSLDRLWERMKYYVKNTWTEVLPQTEMILCHEWAGVTQILDANNPVCSVLRRIAKGLNVSEDEFLIHIARCIVGNLVEKGKSYLHESLNSDHIDLDRLDYLCRDLFYCGYDIRPDVDKLINHIVPVIHRENKYYKASRKTQKKYCKGCKGVYEGCSIKLGIDEEAIGALLSVLRTRKRLYSEIYFNDIKNAAEELIARVVYLTLTESDKTDITPELIHCLDEERLINILLEEGSENVKNLIQMYRYREIPRPLDICTITFDEKNGWIYWNKKRYTEIDKSDFSSLISNYIDYYCQDAKRLMDLEKELSRKILHREELGNIIIWAPHPKRRREFIDFSKIIVVSQAHETPVSLLDLPVAEAHSLQKEARIWSFKTYVKEEILLDERLRNKVSDEIVSTLDLQSFFKT